MPEDDGRVYVAEEGVWMESIGEPEGEGRDEPEEEGYGYPLVFSAYGEDVAGHGPGYGEGVELLDVLAGPDVGTCYPEEDLALILDNAVGI